VDDLVKQARDHAEWLGGISVKGGKGVVGNIDARSLGRTAALLVSLADEVARLREALGKLADATFDAEAMARDHYHAECAEADDGEHHPLSWNRIAEADQGIRIVFMQSVIAGHQARALAGEQGDKP